MINKLNEEKKRKHKKNKSNTGKLEQTMRKITK